MSQPTLHHAAAQLVYLINTTPLGEWSIRADVFENIACHCLLLTREQASAWWLQLEKLGISEDGCLDLSRDHLDRDLIAAAEHAEPLPLLAYQLAFAIIAAADDGTDRVLRPE